MRLSPSLPNEKSYSSQLFGMATLRGLEPPTSCVTGRRSTLLSYKAILVGEICARLSPSLEENCLNQRMIKIHRESVKRDFLEILNKNWQAAARELPPHAW